MTLSPVLKDLKTRTSPHGKIMAVSMMKDEAPFLLEWIAHHLAIGFTDILVYTNDCSDGTVEMLQRLEDLGLAYHRENNIPEGIKPQPSALKHAQAEPKVKNADWVLVFDADEFLVLGHPSGHLDGLLDDVTAQGANGIVITWRIFGSSGVVDWSRAPVSEQYTQAAPPLWNKGWGVKTLFKFQPKFWKLGIHRPSIKNKHLETKFPDKIKWLNGSGQPMEDYFKFRGWRSIQRTVGYNWAQMNHYAVKSVDSYAVRKFRGNVNNKADKYNSDYWALQDRNEVEDTTILRHAPRRAEIMEALLEDPILYDLHFAALTRVEARLDAYRKTPAYAELKEGLVEAGKTPIDQVEAKPPKARDPDKIAALMSRVEKDVADKPKPEKPQVTVSPYLTGTIDVSTRIKVGWSINHDINLPADPRVFTPEALNAIISGRFDRRNARNIEDYVEGFQRLLDLQSGIGFIPMRLNIVMPGLSVMAHDERDVLIRVGTDVARENGMETGQRLVFASDPLGVKSGGAGFATYLTDFRPDVLRIGLYTDMPPRILTKAPLASVQRVLIPCAGEEEAAKISNTYTPALSHQGFAETPDRDGAGSVQFDRRSVV